MERIPVVILCGGKGLRLREYTDLLPKALVPVGKMPIILHVMKIYAQQGFNKFILCLGYKGDMVKNYFTKSEDVRDFEITFADTGLETNTGGRIKKIEKYIDNDNFFATYCDGVADIDLHTLYNHHKKANKIATLTAVHPISPFGMIEIEDGLVRSFKEKPTLPSLINGGFFVFNQKIFNYLAENSVLEDEPLKKLALDEQLAAFSHDGFWACMDTYKDVERLNGIWETGYMPLGYLHFKKAPWKIWE